MPPSIAEGPDRPRLSTPAGHRLLDWIVGGGIVLAALVLYAVSNPEHWNAYNHFVWQADAFLHGRAWIPYPVYPGGDQPENWYLQDVYPVGGPAVGFDGRALLPFPPLPAIVLLPFVAAWGLAADQEAVAIGLGALGVSLAWWALGGLRLRTAVRAIAVGIMATGTVWWWATATGSTWYLAHLVATDVAFIAVGVALRHDPRAAEERLGDQAIGTGGGAGGGAPPGRWAMLRSAALPLDRWQVLAGLLLGIAVTARLPMILGAPFLALVGAGGSIPRRVASAAVGGFLPVALLLGYTYLTTGAVLHPGYDYQYRLEVEGYSALGYHADWSVEDPRYIPGNLGIMIGSLPVVLPDVLPDTLGVYDDVPLCAAPDSHRSLFDTGCPLAIPVDVGTSLLLSAPGLLLALFAVRHRGRSRLVLGALLAVAPIAVLNLAHFSQGWVQWGYRFSLDFLPFLMPLVALGVARPVDGRPRLLAYALLVAGALVNLWGVIWGQLLGW